MKNTENQKAIWRGWKWIAITFIILFVLETSLIAWGVSLVNKEESNIKECSLNLCEPYSAYYYDTVSQVCYCYEGKEVMLTKYLP
jgi:hypothetical protein